MLAIWWYYTVVYFEMLPINSDVFCQHLMKIGGRNKVKTTELANRVPPIQCQVPTYLARPTNLLELDWQSYI